MSTIKQATRQEEEIVRLMEVWKSSVQATHQFLTKEEMACLYPLVREALKEVEKLMVYCDDKGILLGFAGVDKDKLEMLFVDNAARGRGVGKQLLRFAVEELGAATLDVNEQNPQAVGFYQHMGFEIYGQSAVDGQGRPFPLLHMRLRANER